MSESCRKLLFGKGPPNNYVIAFTKIFKRRQLFRGKVGKFSVDVMTAFFGEKNKEANCPSGGVHLDLRIWRVSKISLSEVSESSSLSWKKACKWQRNISTSCLIENSLVRLAIGTQFRPENRFL